jgi:hypothetical protein
MPPLAGTLAGPFFQKRLKGRSWRLTAVGGSSKAIWQTGKEELLRDMTRDAAAVWL